MSDTVDFDGPWCSSTEECRICGHVQVSVYPITCARLECSRCGNMNPAPQLDEDGERVRRDWHVIEEITGGAA